MRSALLAGAILVGIVSSPAHAQVLPPLSVGPGVVLTDNLKLRTYPDTRAPILTRLPCLTKVEILGWSVDGKWYRVKVGERSGFVFGEYVGPQGSNCGDPPPSPAPTPPAFIRVVVVTPILNVRASPDLRAPILARLNQGDVIEVVAQTPDKRWLAIRFNGKLAFVFAQYTSFQDSR